MTKIAGSGSISQRHGSADPDPEPDPHQIVMDPEHWFPPFRLESGFILLTFGILFFFKISVPELPVPVGKN
jgi:hypothetical protein